MTTPLRVRLPDGAYRGVGLEDIYPDFEAGFKPTSYSSLDELIEGEGLPADASYVMWNPAWTHLEQANAALAANDILVLEERDQPYFYDTSKGFMAKDVEFVDGTGLNGFKDGSRVPVVSNPRLWFEMTRARRGIVGMGPRAVIAPSASSFTAPRQPILQNEAPGDRTQLRYMFDGSTAEMVGVQEKVIGCEHPRPVFANFTMRGRSFGGIAYNGIALSPGVGGHSIVSRIDFDGSWRGFTGVPNGETGALTFLRGTFELRNFDLQSDGGPSPIMWNRTEGGSMRMVRSSKPNYGMLTFWRCGGLNTFEDVFDEAAQIGMNLEENLAGFELDWTRGSLSLDHPTTSRFHLNINPSNGSIKVRFHGVEISPNGYTPARVSAHVYTTAGVQKKADVTSDTLPIAYLNGTAGVGWLD